MSDGDAAVNFFIQNPGFMVSRIENFRGLYIYVGHI